MIEHYILMIK